MCLFISANHIQKACYDLSLKFNFIMSGPNLPCPVAHSYMYDIHASLLHRLQNGVVFYSMARVFEGGGCSIASAFPV